MTHTPMRTFNRGLAATLATAVLAIAAVTAHGSAHADPMGGGHRHGPGQGMMGGPGMMGGMMSERALDAVNATAEQRAQVKQIMDAARTDMRAQHEAARPLHDQMRQLFTQPTVDARAAETMRQQLLAQHDRASQRMMQAMLDVSRVLTPEQRTKLAELMAQRRAMMEQRRGQQPR
jgi:Spy/CpxP family protein refolding chaperone